MGSLADARQPTTTTPRRPRALGAGVVATSTRVVVIVACRGHGSTLVFQAALASAYSPPPHPQRQSHD